MLIFYPYNHILGYHWRVAKTAKRDIVPSCTEGPLHTPEPGDKVYTALCGRAWRRDLRARGLDAVDDSGAEHPDSICTIVSLAASS